MSVDSTLNTSIQLKRSIDATTVETGVTSSSSNQGEEDAEAIDPSPGEQRRTLRKIDVRICVVLGLIQCLSHMDRSNFAAASIAGMRSDLQLGINNRYNIAALVFFIPFVFCEFVSPVIVRSIGTRPFLSILVILWGAVTVATGFVNNWEQLAGLRVLLGVLESSGAPITIHMLSAWYTRYEVQKRYAVYLIFSICITSFSGIIAYGFLQTHGVGGLNGWRWTYIWFGILTVLMGVIVCPFVVEFPDKVQASSRFLNDQEINWVMKRLEADRGDVRTEPFQFRKFLQGACSLPAWLFAAIFCCCTTIGYCVGFFLPIIMRSLGFSVAESLCLATPPYLFPAVTIYASGWIGDRYRLRSPIIVGNAVFTMVGLILQGWASSNGVKYFSFFVINGSILANIPALLAYQANNIRGQWVRALSSALIVFGGAAGGIFGSLMFSNAGPAAIKRGILGCIAVNGLIIVITVVLALYFVRQNHLAKKGLKVIYGQPGFLYSI